MELIENKRVGKVLLIVEGSKHEFSLMKKIFVDVLGYTQIEKSREREEYYVREGDKHSIVAVVNTKTSNISSINSEEYLDQIYEELIEKYEFDIDNTAIYYLFDRDPKSNTDTVLIKKLIQCLKNSRENDENMRNGMLILSYPAVEAYEISSFEDESYNKQMRLGSDAKKYINEHAKTISMNKICKANIIHAGVEMLKYLEQKKIPLDLDEFNNTNGMVFDEQEKNFRESDTFRILSMISCVLMDLGVLIQRE